MMAIEKNNFKAPRFDTEFSPVDMDSEEDEEEMVRLPKPSVVELNGDVEEDRAKREEKEGDDNADEEEDEDEFNDVDSGAGSDDFDLLELGDSGAEFCQIGNVTCSVPYELYDLSGLEHILSTDIWNEVLTEEEKHRLTKYLPDMDQVTFVRTLKELFEGENFHFGSPVKKLYDMLKRGLCEPRVTLYKEGLSLFQKRHHYHMLRNHHNSMIVNLCQIRDTWFNCKGYSIEEKLRFLNIVKSQNLMREKVEEGFGSDSLEESGDTFHGKRLKGKRSTPKVARVPGYGIGSRQALRMPIVSREASRHGKPNSVGKHLPFYDGLRMSPGLLQHAPAEPQFSKSMGNDTRRGKMRVDYEEDEPIAADAMYEMGYPSTQNTMRGSGVVKAGLAKAVKRAGQLRHEVDRFLGLPLSLNTDNRTTKMSSEWSNYRSRSRSYQNDLERRIMYSDGLLNYPVADHVRSVKGRSMQLPISSDRFGLPFVEPSFHTKSHGELFPTSEELNMNMHMLEKGREYPVSYFKHYRSASPQTSDAVLISDLRAKQSKDKSIKILHNGRSKKSSLKVMCPKNDETESDSSEYFDNEDKDHVVYTKKKSGSDAKKTKSLNKKVQDDEMGSSGITHVSKKGDSLNDFMPTGYSSKGKTKGINQNVGSLDGSMVGLVEHNSTSSRGKLKDSHDRKPNQKIGKISHRKVEPDRNSPFSTSKIQSMDRKQKSDKDKYDSVTQDEYPQTKNVKKRHKVDQFINSRAERSEASLLGCSSVTKKQRKIREVEPMELDGVDDEGDTPVTSHPPCDDPVPVKKKGKRKMESDNISLDAENFQPQTSEAGTPLPVMESEVKPVKKPYAPITPSVHTDFSFSIVHLLTAVRMALITPVTGAENLKDDLKNSVDDGSIPSVSYEGACGGNESENANQATLPQLTVPQIVDRVVANPCDPCILETQEPLHDLVRGVLKIFSSKTAPLGAKGWKPLVGYEKSNKSWSWVGPVSDSTTDLENNEVTSPEYWSIPHKMLVKVVDSFANWLKCGHETLQQIGSLPAPPLSLMQCNLDEKERFRDLRAQKSLNTFSPSPEEVRSYFRKEELLRYSVPDRAFSYTAADGKKSIVAPLRRCGGKPTSKARDHFMLKRDRPPHVTILCLVRDAAARLPGSIGTRADVCTLIRDSQYIVEDVADAQVNQVVSGALDRLHYERDPCVQFDSERKLWVYLHREREEEDFEDDGTSSTKKWKRQKKDSNEPDSGIVTGFDLGSDLNAEPPTMDGDKKSDMVDDGTFEAAAIGQDDVTPCVANDNVKPSHELDESLVIQDDPLRWEALNLHPEPAGELLCQENSVNEDYGDESFGRDGHMELLSASLS